MEDRDDVVLCTLVTPTPSHQLRYGRWETDEIDRHPLLHRPVVCWTAGLGNQPRGGHGRAWLVFAFCEI